MESHAAGHSDVGHEISTVELRPVIAFAIILVVVTIASFITAFFLLDYLKINQARTEAPLSPLADPNQIPPDPRLQVASGQDLRQMHASEDIVLDNYHWVDKEAGIVGIPIQRAIELMAEKGLPTRTEAKPER